MDTQPLEPNEILVIGICHKCGAQYLKAKLEDRHVKCVPTEPQIDPAATES